MTATRKSGPILTLAAVLMLSGCVAVATPAGSVQGPVRPSRLANSPQSVGSREPNGILTQVEFAGELAAELERLRPGWTAVNHGGEAVELWAGEVAGVSLPVGPVYGNYRGQPERRTDLIREAAQQATDVYAAASNWESASRYLLPQLVSVERYQQLDESGAMPVSIQLSDSVLLVFDLRVNSMSVLVHQGLQVSWRQSSDTIYQQALDNLERITPDMVKGQDGVWRFPTDDEYAAVRVLLTHRLTVADAKTPGSLVIALPSQDRLYAFEAADGGLLASMRDRTDMEFRESERSLTPAWLTLREGRLVLYEMTLGQG